MTADGRRTAEDGGLTTDDSFKDLRVYQEACALDLEIFLLSKSFPKEEQYSLTDQIRRSSRSIGANLSEAWEP